MALTLTLHQSLTDKQRAILREPSNFLTLSGPAGTSKTYIALARGLKMLERDKVEKIVIIRSAVEIRSIGFLPGDHSEKLDVYAAPYIHLINELSPKKNYRALVGAKEIEFHSTSFLRGMTFDYSYIIADEYQNMNKHELETIITRVGDGTQLVLCGDSDQTDLKYQEAVEHKEVIETLKLMPDFAHYEFTSDEIVRSEFVKRYYQAKEGTLTTPNFLTRTARANGG